MTAASRAPKTADTFDPDAFRMSVGDHLEELRGRLILALVGLGIGFVVCLFFVKDYVLPFVCGPLLEALQANGVNPQVYFRGVTGPFVIYLKVAFIGGLALASPWVLWQFWQFVAAGLYPQERKTVTKYIPLSLVLLLAGQAMAYWVMLPLTLTFFLGFGTSIPLPTADSPTAAPPPGVVVQQITPLTADPIDPAIGDIWLNLAEGQVKIFNGGERPLVMPFAPETLAAPLIELPDYVSLVLLMLLVFGVAFQTPLVVLGLVTAGIVEVEDLAANRKYVIFGLAIASAFATPADPFTMIALMVPLAILFEFGILLARRGEKIRNRCGFDAT
jgi:sec-independent protein translocase protein TatC